MTFLIFFFCTLLNAATTKFIIIGDTGKDNNGQQRVSWAITENCKREICHAGMLAGDNVYDEGMSSVNDPIMQHVFEKYYSHLNFPFYVALGNHDYGKWSNSWSRGEFQIEYAKGNPQFILPKNFYYHEGDEYVLAVLDTTRLMWSQQIKEQKKMLNEAAQISKTKGKWLLVLGHHPYLSNGTHGNAGHYEGLSIPSFVSGTDVEEFLRKNVCGRAHLYISGHDHSLQLLDGHQKKCNTRLVVSGSGASVTELKDRNKALFQALKLGFVVLKVDAQQLYLQFWDHNLVMLYHGIIKKPQTK